MGHPRACGLLLVVALVAAAILVSLEADAQDGSAAHPEFGWEPDGGLRVGRWHFGPEGMWFSASRSDGVRTESTMHPSSKYGRSLSRRAPVATGPDGSAAHPLPPDALPEPGGERSAWIESRCEAWDDVAVWQHHLCVTNPGDGDPRICFHVPRERLVDELEERFSANTGQQTAMLDRLFAREQEVHILHTDAGPPACRVRTLGGASSGDGTWSASLFHETTQADGCVQRRSVSVTIGPCPHDRCEAVFSGPGGFDECPDGTSRGFGVGEFWTVSVDYGTDEFLAVGGERWFADPAACERAALAERALDWQECRE